MSNSIPKTSGIYKITCIDNGRFYIGSSNDLHRRLGGHRSALNKHKHCNQHLQNAWNKYGEDGFIFEVIELVMPWAILDREQYWLDNLKPFGKQGFNINRIADKPPSPQGRKHSPESLVRMSMVQTGHPVSNSTRIAVGNAQRGKIESEETRLKKSLAHTGMTRSIEAVEKTAEPQRKIYIVVSPDGIEQTIKGLSRFCRGHGLNHSMMSAVANGKRKQHHGWKCRYG